MVDVIDGSDGLTDEQRAAQEAEKNKPWFAGHEEEPAIEVGEDKLSLKQLKEGHLRQADYSRKTAELAQAWGIPPEQVAEAIKAIKAGGAKPPEKQPGTAGRPATQEEWVKFSNALWDTFGQDPTAKLTELVGATTDEKLTVYDVSKEVGQALKENPTLTEWAGGNKERAKQILWDTLRSEMGQNGAITADEVAKSLLKGLPPKTDNKGDSKGKMKPEREGSPVGAQEKPPKKYDERGDITLEYSQWNLEQGRKRGEVGPAED